ncbi:SRPBCC family protein [Leekyejoonella antrihumi]|uniref:ATPase n=1 Tax=Leekyejoonella antrihumi TaxID=1660198 RepID=A0A563E5T6_9MICO|nr:SRPBCC family protein [Leekyejoonella antrihumi]TWP37900.1 ATPase [Leekyejoonella antrihumi]
MTRTTETAVVRRQIVVEASIERAFTVFTEQFGDFKPPEHNLLAVPIERSVFEPRVGGHLYDRGVDGSECRWARVLAYEPPDRVVFSWDIGPQWQLEADPANTSEVEVRFIAETPGRTRVELEHRNIDRHGSGWQGITDAIGGDAGWPLYLSRYAALFADGT